MTNTARAKRVELIVMGGSAGAIEALRTILPSLPTDFSIPIVIVLHVPPEGPSRLVESLGPKCCLPIKEAEDKEPILSGCVYVAPPNYHLLVEHTRTLALSVDDLVHFSRPSIDVLFESAADAYGASLAAVLLTGANTDGAAGLARTEQLGGIALVQSPQTAYMAAMPTAGARVVKPEHVLPLSDIGSFLARLGETNEATVR